MPAKQKGKNAEERMEEKLDELLRLLEDIFILQALKSGMNNAAIRKLLGVRMTRVSGIAKHIE